MRKPFLILVLLVGLTFAVRMIVALNTYVMTEDGPFYLNTASKLAEGNYTEITTRYIVHPLYPFLIAVTHALFNSIFHINWEWAGMLIAIIFSAIAVIPLYFIGRRYFPGFIVVITCILYAFHHRSVEISASVFTTGVFIGIFLFALWVTIIALESNKYRYFLLSGLLSFLMYLVRPDGAVFLVISVIGCAFNPLNSGITNNNITKKAKSILILIIPWICLMPPYLSVYSISGETALTNKVSIKKMIGFTEESALHDTDGDIVNGDSGDADIDSPLQESRERSGSRIAASAKAYLNGIYLLSYYFIKGANPLLIILFFIGVIGYFKKVSTIRIKMSNKTDIQADSMPDGRFPISSRTDAGNDNPVSMIDKIRNIYRDGSFFIWLVFIIFTLVFFRYAIIYGKLSTRYTVPLIIMMMFWAGNGLCFISNVISRLIRNNNEEVVKKICYLSLIFIVVFFSFYTFRPVRKFKVIEKTTGELLNNYHLLRAEAGTRPAVIITRMARLAYYAGGVNVIPERWDRDNQKMLDIIEALKDTVREKNVDYIVLDSRITRKLPDLEKELSNLGGNIKAELISSYFNNGADDCYRVYQFIPSGDDKR